VVLLERLKFLHSRSLLGRRLEAAAWAARAPGRSLGECREGKAENGQGHDRFKNAIHLHLLPCECVMLLLNRSNSTRSAEPRSGLVSKPSTQDRSRKRPQPARKS